MALVTGGFFLFLWAGSGFVTFRDFCMSMPHRVREVRRTFMLAAAWIFRRHFAYLHRLQYSVALVGDADAHPETVDKVLTEWDKKHVCCMPPGLARELKKEGIRSVDLLSPEWKQTMFWTAATMQLSCADIESMHSQNRALAGSAFHSISARFINSESNRFAKEAIDVQKAALKKDKPTANAENLPLGNPQKERIGRIVVVDGAGKKPSPKAMSPLELYRQHHLKTFSSTGSLNPCSKECWADVKAHWENLSPQEKQLYKELSDQSALDASAERKRRSRANVLSEKNVAVEPSDVVPMVSAGNMSAIHTQALPLSDLCELVSQPDLLQKAVHKQIAHTSSIPKAEYPLREEALERAWLTQRSKGITGKESIKSFRVEAERIARPSDGDVFPEKVRHESFCGDQCRHFADRSRIDLHSRLMTQFQEIVAFKGGVKNVVLSDVLCSLAVS